MILNQLGKGRFYGWINLSIGAMSFFIMNGAVMFSFGVFLPFLCQEFTWSRGAISMAMSINMLVTGFSAPLAGMFISKYGTRRAILVGNPLAIIGFLLMAFQTHLWQLYLGYGFFCGFGMAIGGMLAISTMVNHWFVKKRSLALSITMAASGMGGVILVPLIMWSINNFGWRYTYLLLASAILLFNTIIGGLFIRNKPEDLDQVPDGIAPDSVPTEEPLSTPSRAGDKTPVNFTFGEAVRTPALWLITAFMSLQMLTLQGIMAHQIAFLVDIGITTGMAATAMGIMMGTSTVARLGTGFLGLKYNMHFLAIASMALTIVGMILMIFTKTVTMAFIYNVFLGIGLGGTVVSIMTIIPNYFGAENFPKIIGFTTPFSTLITCMGAPLAGFIRDGTGSYLNAFQLFILISIVAFVCLIFSRAPVHPSLVGQPVPDGGIKT